MEVKISKSALKNAITAVKKALPKVVIQEERGHLLFSVDGDIMTVQATNNDMKACCTVAIENVSKENFSFTGDPKILEKLLVKIDIETIRITFDAIEFVVKIYTTESEKSFSSMQSFPPDKMLTFDLSSWKESTKYPVDKEVLLFTLNYSKNFLAALKDDQKQFDFIVIDKGYVYAANGTNKMGFLVFKAYGLVESLKIRKNVLPLFTQFIENIKGASVQLFETKNNIGVVTDSGDMVFMFLKSNVGAPNIPKDHIKSEGPYTLIEKNRLLKVIDRLMASNVSKTNFGVELNLTGSGENAVLQVSLLSSLKNTESFPCVRKDDGDEDVSHVIDYKIFKSIMASFDTDKEVRLHINDSGKAYKVYSSGEVSGNKYVLVGRGSYAKAKVVS